MHHILGHFNSPFFGEMLGSLFMILFGGGAVATVLLKQSKGENGGWIVITAGWGFAVMIGVFVAQAAGSPQADLNPIVTLTKYCFNIYNHGGYVLCLMSAQVIGCFLGAILVWLVYLPHWKVTDNTRFKLVIFSTSPEIKHKPSNFLCECIATFALIVIVGSLIKFGKYNHFAVGEMPYVFAFAIWGIGISLGGPTGYAINPARDLGPRIAHMLLPIHGKGDSEWGYAWVPVLGPLLGGVIGIIFIDLFML